MDPLFSAALFGVLGIVALVGGAELLVRASVDIGLRLRLSALIVGLTIVSFATSAPELVVSLQASLQGAGDVALGNVFGSNLANIGLILGFSALVTPLAVDRFSVRVDGPLMLGMSIVAGLFAWDGQVNRWQGAVLFALLIAYLVFRIRLARRTENQAAVEGLPEAPRYNLAIAVVLLIVGIGLLVLGGTWLVNAATTLAEAFGVPPKFIALTIVAVGTSLPELATSVLAACKGEADIAVGNVLGSNIFNVGGVLGLSALAASIRGGGFGLEIVAMLVLSAALLPFLRSGARITRWEGALLLVGYAVIILLAS